MSKELAKIMSRFAAAHAKGANTLRARSFEDYLLKGTHQGKQAAYNFAFDILEEAMVEMDDENINHDQWADILRRVERVRAQAEVKAQNAVTVTTYDAQMRGQHIGRRDGYTEILNIVRKHQY